MAVCAATPWLKAAKVAVMASQRSGRRQKDCFGMKGSLVEVGWVKRLVGSGRLCGRTDGALDTYGVRQQRGVAIAAGGTHGQPLQQLRDGLRADVGVGLDDGGQGRLHERAQRDT